MVASAITPAPPPRAKTRAAARTTRVEDDNSRGRRPAGERGNDEVAPNPSRSSGVPPRPSALPLPGSVGGPSALWPRRGDCDPNGSFIPAVRFG